MSASGPAILYTTVFPECWAKLSGEVTTDVSRESSLLKYRNEYLGFYMKVSFRMN